MPLPLRRLFAAGLPAAAALAALLGGASLVHANVSHKGWPAITGRHWSEMSTGQRRGFGTPRNDELLGGHGSDVVSGRGGADVIWGDSLPSGQPSGQHDVLYGGAGNDWLYTSHGTNTVHAGTGKDFVWAYYGHGVIDCGPGNDTVRVRMNGAYRLIHCEHVRHFCTWGDNAHGGCLKPGEKGARRQPALG